METIETANWEDFESRLKRLREDCRGDIPTLLYRGQGNEGYHLETSLERERKPSMRIGDYYRLMAKIKPEIETLTGKNWDVPEWEEDAFKSNGFSPITFSYMIYLRHHEFPSPLLDWSYSPYIAAFFAFRKSHDVGKRAIYVFREFTKRPTKSYWEGQPEIHVMRRDVRSHRRHFLQQSAYTLCYDDKLSFGSHEEVSKSGKSHQDILYKFLVPNSERNEVLRLLGKYNLNAFSLFQTVESLMETLWTKESVKQTVAGSIAA